MKLRVVQTSDGHRPSGDGSDVEAVNRFLSHLAVRAFSPATVRAYAFDLLNFLRFSLERGLAVGAIAPGDLFDYLGWQSTAAKPTGKSTVASIGSRRGAAAATTNRRIAAVRGCSSISW